MRTLRLFKILDWLRSQKYPISAERLADEMDVSIRTIYRDMVTLQQMGAPIRGEGGIGYQIEKGYFLPPLHFDADELDAVVLGIRMAAARGDTPMADAASRALGKITSVLSDERRNADQPLLAVGNDASRPVRDRIGPLRAAIRERHKVEMDYLDLKDVQTSRTLRPLGLTAFENVWVLTAWCEARDGFRNFRMDRIKSCRITTATFPWERGREFADYLKTL